MTVITSDDSQFITIDTTALSQVDLASVAKASALHEVLLFGEYHDDPVAHSVELTLFRYLLRQNGYPTDGFSPSPSRSSFIRSSIRSSHSNSSPSWGDPRLGFTGSPNLWTALHNDPHLFSSSVKPSGQDQPSLPDLPATVTTAEKPRTPAVPSFNPFTGASALSQQQASLPTLARPQSAPPPHHSENADMSTAAAPSPVPNTFQSLSGAKPGVVSACLSSTLGGPTGGPSMTSAAANAAAADAVRPMIRSGVSYMSQSFSNLYGLLTARRAPHASDDHSPASMTSPPSIASDLDSLADHPTAPAEQPSDDPSPRREASSQAGLSPLSHCASPRASPPRTPTPSATPAPALDRRPATAPNPRSFTGPPIAAAGPHHPHAHAHALPYSTWIWSNPDACSHPDLHLYDMDSITAAAAATPDVAKVCTAGSKLGLPLTKEFYAAYQRSPLAHEAHEAEGPVATPPPRTPLAAAASAAAGAVASKTVAEASAAAAGAAGSLDQLGLSADASATPRLPRGDAAGLDRIMRGNGLSLACCDADFHSHVAQCGGAATAVGAQGHLSAAVGWACSALVNLCIGSLAWPAVLVHAATMSGANSATSCSNGAESLCATVPSIEEVASSVAASSAAAARPCRQREVILSMEMFERDVQHVLDEYCVGAIPARDLLFDGRAWPNFASDYSVLLDTAAAARVRVVAANAPRRYVSLVGRHGFAALSDLPAPQAACLPDTSLMTPVSAALRSKIRREFAAGQGARVQEPGGGKAQAGDDRPSGSGSDASSSAQIQPPAPRSDTGECPYVGLRLSDNFLAAQGLWDACMADSILAALGRTDGGDCSSRSDTTSPAELMRRPIVMHVCGKFHMEERLGICERLVERAPGVSVGTVVAVPVDLARVRTIFDSRPISEFSDHEIMPGMNCTVGYVRGLADFVVLTDSGLPRSF